MPVPERPPQHQVDRVSDLLAHVLDAESTTQAAMLDDLCAAHPEYAAVLRQGFGALQHMQMLEIGRQQLGSDVAPAAATNLPRAFGSFRLLEFLGSGGMGSVYRAEDPELKRPVALKLVRSELLASDRARRRFHRESEALARLDHPGLCTVYSAGSTDGQPWIAMRLVRGKSLADEIAARQQTARATPTDGTGRRRSSHTRDELDRTLMRFEQTATALAAAHAAGVIHRDVKPANIVLDSSEQTVVIDFGLVHLEGSESHLTMSGDHVGTPAYMAPEQVAAGRDPGPATDVYALGVTLFETLTLQSPYQAASREELFHCIVRGERRRLRQVDRTLPHDLEVVLEKALDVDPGRRYASMTEFAADLRLLRQHEPPVARRIGGLLRLRRWCQRNPVATTIVVLLTIGLCTALVLERSRRAAQQLSLAMAYGNLAGQLLDDNPEHALDMALRCVELAPGNPEALRVLLQALQEVHPHEVWPLPWSSLPDTMILRAAPGGDAALILEQRLGQRDRAPILWRNDTTTLLPILDGMFDADWSADGSEFLTTGPNGPPRLWSAAGELLATLPVPGEAGTRVPRARFLHTGQVLMACSDGMARILDRTDDHWIELQPRLCLQQDGMPGLALSADGKRIALGDRDGRVVVHETAAALHGEPGRVLVREGDSVADLDLGATGALLQVSNLSPYRCSIWTWEGAHLAGWGSAEAPATPLPLDRQRERAFEYAQDRIPRSLRLVHGKLELQHALAGHDGRLTDACIAADGTILTLGVDGTARLWDSETGRTMSVLRGFTSELRRSAFLGGPSRCLLVTSREIHRFDLGPVAGVSLRVGKSRDTFAQFLGPQWPGSMLTADSAQRVTLHDAEGRVTADIREPYERRSGLQVAAGARWLCTASQSISAAARARVYRPDLTLAQEFEVPLVSPQPIFGPDDQLLLIDTRAPKDGNCALLLLPSGGGHWQEAAHELREQFAAACSGAQSVAWHAPTATLAVGRPGASVTVQHWAASPPALQSPRDLLPQHSTSHLIAFSPDGRLLLLACRDRVVRLIDRNGTILATFEGHIGFVEDIAFSPRGDQLLIAATESGVTLHDLAGRLILPIQPRTGGVTMATFLPDGHRVLFSTTARVTSIVPTVPDALVELARAVGKPVMSPQYRASYQRRVGDY